MNIAMVTTCKGRTAHLARTLPKNIADNPNARFVVLDYNDHDSLAVYLQTNHAEDMASGKLAVYQYKDSETFRMAHAKNLAHRLGIIEGGEILVNIDADNFTGPGFAEYVQEQFKSAGDVFLWSRMVKGEMPRGISGRIAVKCSDFFLAGGYDEKYETHSPDDKDFNLRLRGLGIEPREIDPKFLSAINHNNKMRYREYPEAAGNGGEDFNVNPTNSVVNGGAIGCGTVYRNFEPIPITIGPVPTRIFGIGMHKTATQSLHAALKILGYKSGHWETAKWAKAIWREMNQAGKSPTLEKFHAVSDLPIPLLFKELDRGYPGSKFILTVRDEWKWLQSIERHWNPKHNRFRCQWDGDAFSHRIHQMLYGRTTFDAWTMLERYRRHNAEVTEYFKNRPSDLLVMDLTLGHGWKELCSFLDQPIPSQPYPRISATELHPDEYFVI